MGTPWADLLGDDHAVVGGVLQAGVQGIQLCGGTGNGHSVARATLQLYELPGQRRHGPLLCLRARPLRHQVEAPLGCILQLRPPCIAHVMHHSYSATWFAIPCSVLTWNCSRHSHSSTCIVSQLLELKARHCRPLKDNYGRERRATGTRLEGFDAVGPSVLGGQLVDLF